MLTTTSTFDREEKSEYYVMVVAEDGAKSDRPNHYPPGTANQGKNGRTAMGCVFSEGWWGVG